MWKNYFFSILVVLQPYAISGAAYHPTYYYCEDLAAHYRVAQSPAECEVAFTTLYPDYTLQTTTDHSNEESSANGPCGCTFNFNGNIDFWGVEGDKCSENTGWCTGTPNNDWCLCVTDTPNTVVVAEKVLNFGDKIMLNYNIQQEQLYNEVYLQRKKVRTPKDHRSRRQLSQKSGRQLSPKEGSKRSNDPFGKCTNGGRARHTREDVSNEITNAEEKTHWADSLYQYTCTDASDYDTCEEPKTNGTMKFQVDKGYSFFDNHPQWPPIAGEWRACDPVFDRCDTFTINPLAGEVLKEAIVVAGKKKYKENENITVSFEKPEQYANTWIGIYDRAQMESVIDDITNEEQMKPENKYAFYDWAFTGCNNKSGNLDNGGCSIKKKSGSVDLGSVGAGTYYVCLSFDFDEKSLDNIICADERLKVVGKSKIIKNIKPVYEFDDKLDMQWINSDQPNIEDEKEYFIHIYAAEVKDYHEIVYWERVMRKSACIEVDPSGDTCDEPQKTGSFIFSEKTFEIVDTNGWTWPPPSGHYRACLVDESEFCQYPEVLSCQRFKIKPLPKSVIKAASVTMDLMVYEESLGTARITGSYNTPKKATANMWLGVYYSDNFNDDNTPIHVDDYVDYVWASCVDYVPDDSNECRYGLRDKEGTFDFPLDDYGLYRLCLIYDDNYPYQYIKCGEEFEYTS